MFMKKMLAGFLSLAMLAGIGPVAQPATELKAAESPKEITLEKTEFSNPIGSYDTDGNMIYGGDPSILVDGDTVYLYVGHDTSTGNDYYMPDWMCYSTKDLKNWKYEGIFMSGDKDAISWARSGHDAWASQVMKYNNKYYFYYCTWDTTASGKQSIGVAVSDSPTGGFKDIGNSLVKGNFTNPQASDYDDIDPTVWVDEDEDGVEHRYLGWGNSYFFICELNEDMTSVKDLNGDGKITFGREQDGASRKTADIIQKDVRGKMYTEAPYFYRRQDEEGNYTGAYYLFYATNWREALGYTTFENNMIDDSWGNTNQIMDPTVTSNTNHPAVFDFKGKTYMVYHNGSLPGGSGYRRSPCITEINFNADGSIKFMEDTATGLFGTTSLLYTYDGSFFSHKELKLSNIYNNDLYPILDLEVGTYSTKDDLNARWAIMPGKADKTKDSYVSLQSENKPGLYVTVDDDESVKLAQDYDFTAKEATAKKQTFKTVEGLADSKGVSFESLSKPGKYLTVFNGKTYLTSGNMKEAATFYQNVKPNNEISTKSSDNSLKSISVDGKACTLNNGRYECEVGADTSSVEIKVETSDSNGVVVVNDALVDTGVTKVNVNSAFNQYNIKVFAADGSEKETAKLLIKKTKDFSNVSFGSDPVIRFGFEDNSNLTAVYKGLDTPEASSPSYTINKGAGIRGNCLYLAGDQGVDLGSANALGDSYTISFWVNPEVVNGSVDPVLAGGTFSPEYWLNLTCDAKIWSKKTDYISTTAANAYKANQWNHIVLTVDASSGNTATSKGKLYLNGKLISQGNVAAGIMSQSGARIFLGVNGWDAYLKGSFDELLGFNRVLSSEEIEALSYDKFGAASSGSQANDKKDETGTSASTGTSTSESKASLKTAKIKVKKGKKSVKAVTIKKGKKVTLKVSVNSKAKLSMKKLTKKQKKIAKVTFKNKKLQIKAKKKGSFKIKLTAKKTSTYKKATKTIKVKVR
ncbi:MAG: family 43 glycosylhydrolase [Eubacterium sp.]|nr:family 43 glycosylhydrolase [Eubacterium sp.]